MNNIPIFHLSFKNNAQDFSQTGINDEYEQRQYRGKDYYHRGRSDQFVTSGPGNLPQFHLNLVNKTCDFIQCLHFNLSGAEGLEPPGRDLESRRLPLTDAPKKVLFAQPLFFPVRSTAFI